MQSPELIAQRELVRRLGGISAMTLYRWRRAGIVPEPTVIRKRNYWPADTVRAVVAAATASKAEAAE